MIRLLKIFFAVSVAVWGLAGFLTNAWQMDLVHQSVISVTTMPYLEPHEAPMWRTSSAAIIWLGIIGISLGKIGAFLFCSIGAFKMWHAVSAPDNQFLQASKLAIVGCGIGFGMLFLGFLALGDGLYEMYRAPGLDLAGELALRYMAGIGLIMLFLAQPATPSP